MSLQHKLNKHAERTIGAARAAVHKCWVNACQFDGIPIDSKFVVFSKDNPHERWYQLAMKEYLRLCREYESGGYVGLTIKNGKAVL